MVYYPPLKYTQFRGLWQPLDNRRLFRLHPVQQSRSYFWRASGKKVVLYAGHEQQIRCNVEVVSYLYAGAAGSSDDAINSFD